jgi:hypothetical protein
MERRMERGAITVMAAVTALAGIAVTAAHAELPGAAGGKPVAGGEVTIHVNPGGTSLANLSSAAVRHEVAEHGLAAQSPVSSLQDAQAIIAATKVKNATILVHGGVYRDSGTTWDQGAADGTITVEPQPGTGAVTFEGRAAKRGYWASVTPKSAKLVFRGPMTVTRYGAGGINATGNKTDGPVRGLVVDGLTFKKLGNAWVAGSMGFGGVHLHYADKAKITNNTFVNLENSTKPGNMHGVYFAFNQKEKTAGSNGNLVQGNTFQVISGDPIRASDGSSNNVAKNNAFKTGRSKANKTVGNGKHGMFTYWVFSRAKVCGKGNKFYGKTKYVTYYNARIAPTFSGSDVKSITCHSVKRAGA